MSVHGDLLRSLLAKKNGTTATTGKSKTKAAKVASKLRDQTNAAAPAIAKSAARGS